MVTKPQAKPGSGVKKPANLDAKRANRIVKRVMKDNVAWLKEMAKR